VRSISTRRLTAYKIPSQFVNVFNELLAAARAWDGADQQEFERIRRLQISYTKGVEGRSLSFLSLVKRYANAYIAHLRHMKKAGLDRPPTNPTEAGMALFGVLSRIAETLEGLYDVQRWQANLPPIVRDDGN
jgi:hypothetical protein